MSRVGKKPIPVGKAKIAINGQKVNVEGPKGKLELNVHELITVKVEEPAKRKSGVKVKTVAELVDKLRNEAKVIP